MQFKREAVQKVEVCNFLDAPRFRVRLVWVFVCFFRDCGGLVDWYGKQPKSLNI